MEYDVSDLVQKSEPEIVYCVLPDSHSNNRYTAFKERRTIYC